MTTLTSEQPTTVAGTDRITVVSADAHAGPLLQEQMRDYCPKRYLEKFDEFVAFTESMPKFVIGPDPDEDPTQSHLRNALSEGGWDPHVRLREMDADGVAAEVIYHGLNAGRQDLLPFSGPFGIPIPGFDEEHLAVGRDMYNRWLVDFVSVAPERHAALCYLPMWDPAAAVEQLQWAAEHGLRGVNFPRPQPSIPNYNDPVWEPFWSACEDLQMPLCTHAQAAGATSLTNLGDFEVFTLDMMGDNGRRAMYELTFGGVFDRHPGLNLVYTEILDTWWSSTMAKMDDLFRYLHEKEASLPPSVQVGGGALTAHKLSKLPSEYCAEQVFIGWTGIARFEAEDAVEKGYDSQVLWGSDYPHPEGSWQYPRFEGEEPVTHLHLRDSFSGVPAEKAAGMLGGNAIRLFGFDAEKLGRIARDINSLTFDRLATPLDGEPEDFATRAAKACFRRTGPFA